MIKTLSIESSKHMQTQFYQMQKKFKLFKWDINITHVVVLIYIHKAFDAPFKRYSQFRTSCKWIRLSDSTLINRGKQKWQLATLEIRSWKLLWCLCSLSWITASGKGHLLCPWGKEYMTRMETFCQKPERNWNLPSSAGWVGHVLALVKSSGNYSPA